MEVLYEISFWTLTVGLFVLTFYTIFSRHNKGYQWRIFSHLVTFGWASLLGARILLDSSNLMPAWAGWVLVAIAIIQLMAMIWLWGAIVGRKQKTEVKASDYSFDPDLHHTEG